MRLMRVGPVGGERPMAWAAPWFAYDLSELTEDIDSEFLSSERFDEARTAVRLRRRPELNIAASVAQSGRFAFLKAGDVVEVEIDGLGRQRNRCHPAPS